MVICVFLCFCVGVWSYGVVVLLLGFVFFLLFVINLATFYMFDLGDSKVPLTFCSSYQVTNAFLFHIVFFNEHSL